MNETKKKHNFITRNREVFLALAIGIILIFGAFFFLNSRDEIGRDNLYNEFDEDRSLIYVTGENYSLSKEQEQEYLNQEQSQKPQEPSRDDILLEEVETESTKPETPKEDGNQILPGDGEGSGNGGDSIGDQGEKDKKPRIICSLADENTFSGKYVHFTVEARDYANRVLSSFYVKVTLNGHDLFGAMDETDTFTTYRNSDYVNDGDNEVIVNVKDDSGRTATVKYKVIVNSEEEREEVGVINIWIDCQAVGKGIIAHNSAMPFLEGENLAEVTKRFLNENGFTPVGSSDSYTGYFLEQIQKPGLGSGINIPEGLRNKLDTPVSEGGWFLSVSDPASPDALGNKDITDKSGWMYKIDGVEASKGLSNFDPEDGMNVMLFFTLNMGYEYEGENFLY